MNYKKIIDVLIGISVVFFVSGFLLSYHPEFLCSTALNAPCDYGFGESLFLGFGQLGIIFLILRFLPKEVFSTWLFFALWYVPLSIVWIMTIPPYGGAFLSPGRDNIILMLGGIYMAVSVVIILVRLTILKLHKKKKQR